MRSSQLFLQRLVNEWKFQFGVFRSVLDWTVVVYLLLPSVIIFGFVYRSWWLETPEWVMQFPVGIVFVVLYFVAMNGHFRTYVHDADQLFVMKHRSLFLRLKLWGFVYSAIFQTITIAIMIVIMLPFMSQFYELSVSQIISLFCLFTVLKWLMLTVKVKMKQVSERLFQNILTVVYLAIFGVGLTFLYPIWCNEQLFLLYLLCFLGIVVIGFIYIPYITKVSALESHLMIEKIERTKYINFIFKFSYEIEKTNVITRKKPLLFRKSQRIFKKRSSKKGFLELFIKVFIRNRQYFSSYLQMVAISSVAISMIPPVWMKIFVFIGALIVLKSWATLVWEKIILAHPLTKKYGELDNYFSAKKLATNVLVVIGGTLFLSAFFFSNMLEGFFSKFLM